MATTVTTSLENLLEATRIASITEDGPAKAIDELKTKLSQEWNDMQLASRELRLSVESLKGELQEVNRAVEAEKTRAFRYQQYHQHLAAENRVLRTMLRLKAHEPIPEVDIAALKVLALTGVEPPLSQGHSAHGR